MHNARRAARLLAASTLAAGTVLALTPAPPVMAAAPQATRSLRAVDLGTLPGASTSTAYGINERGVAVGESDGHAVLWRHRRITDLGGPGDFGAAMDINNRGDVVGWNNVSGAYRAVLWRQGRAVELGTLPGGTTSFAEAINDRGDVVGSGDSTAGLRAILWRHGKAIDLGPAGAVASSARDINERGDAVGEVFLPPNEMKDLAAVWRRGTATVLTEESAQASGVNDRGEVTGFFFGSPGSFLWRQGVMTRIAPPAGAIVLQTQAINNRAQVVGYTEFDGVRWDDGRLTVLPGLAGSRGSAAHDINDRGQIVGSASSTGDGLNPHAVLWLPAEHG